MLSGFRWGYQLRDQKLAIVGPSVLEDGAWDDDLAILRTCCPTWSFIPRRATG